MVRRIATVTAASSSSLRLITGTRTLLLDADHAVRPASPPSIILSSSDRFLAENSRFCALERLAALVHVALGGQLGRDGDERQPLAPRPLARQRLDERHHLRTLLEVALAALDLRAGGDALAAARDGQLGDRRAFSNSEMIAQPAAGSSGRVQGVRAAG
jgi:hypothetical protein